MVYEFGSLEELANFLDTQARGCSAYAARAKTEKMALAERYAANAWTLAAEIVRKTKLTPDASISELLGQGQ